MPSNFNNTTNNRANNRTSNRGQGFAISTEDFLKNEIFAKQGTHKVSAEQSSFRRPTTLLAGDEAMSTEDFLRKEVFYSDPNNLNQNNSASNNKAQKTASVNAKPLDYSTEPLQLKLNFDNNKKLIQKFEASIARVKEYEYSFDAAGHLLCAYCDDKLQEQYYYNKLGQRIKAVTTQAKAEYVYNPIGQMVYSTETDYEYDTQGRLVSKKNKNGNTIFEYNHEITTLLTRIVLPNSTCIDYLYAGTTPVLKYLDSVLSEEYLWANPYQLAEWRDHVNKLCYRFEYSDSSPNVAKLAPIALIIGTQRYSLGCDQLGSIKIVQDSNGKLIKNIEYDSFGNVLQDTNPSFVLPLGFAGGLLDKHSNLLHFGYRDYDPKLGRFTCPDPLGDTGGDHDLYDYCVDDPISFSDPSGLEGESVKTYAPIPWYLPFWLADNDHPDKRASLRGIQEGMKERAHHFAAGFLELDELPIPTIPNAIFNETVMPSFKRPKMSEKWNKDGTPRK